MYLRDLHYLRLVIEHGSFAAAAHAVGVSQPAISQAMQRLRQLFASPLLVRSGRRYLPTELALQVASEAASLAQRVDALAAANSPARDRDILRVGLTPSAALVCGPILYNGWCAGHARRRLELTSADEASLLAGLQRHAFDVVVAPRPRGYRASGVTCQTLYQLQPLIYVRHGHPLAGASTLAELQGAAWAAVAPSVRGQVDMLTEAHVVRHMKPPRASVTCADYASLLNLVVNTDLLAVVPHPALLGSARSSVIALRLRETLPLYEMWVFGLPRPRKPVQRVIERLLGDADGLGSVVG